MDHARLAGLCSDGLLGTCRLESGADGNDPPQTVIIKGFSRRTCRHSGHDDLALSFFLAGGARGRGGALAGAAISSSERAPRMRSYAGAHRVVPGMFASNFIMYFISLTTAATLHAHSTRYIDTARQAAEALRPLAGKAAYWLFTLELIGTRGVLVLAGSSAYAIAEASAWRGSLEKKPRSARAVLYGARHGYDWRLGIDFFGAGRRQNDVLVGGHERRACSAPH